MNKKTTLLLSFIVVLIIPQWLKSQSNDTLAITLEQAVKMAQEQSLQSHAAKNRFINGFYSNKSFWRSFYPEISAEGTLPDLNRSLSRITQNDGTDVFIERSQAVSNLDINLQQKIALTGGTISVSSGLDRIDLFGGNNSTSYLSRPVGISLVQPIFGFNSMIWDIKLRKVQEEQFEKRYDEDLEEVARLASENYFGLLQAKMMLKMAKQNKAYNDTIFRISEGRYSMGKIAENELLQIELALLNSDMALRQADLQYTIAELRLKNYLGITGNIHLKVEIEEEVPPINIDLEKAIEMAIQYNSSQIQWEANQLGAERDVANAKAGQRPNIDLFANYGLSRSAADLDEVYQDPQDQQLLRVGFRVPIVNWGRAKADYQAALAQQEVTNANFQISLLQFQQEVLSQVKNFELKYKEIELAIRADEVAAKRFFVTQQRFKIGKIGMTDLNIATREKDDARRSYINALQSFWNSYYELRKLTHYDFEQQQIIQHSTPEVR